MSENKNNKGKRINKIKKSSCNFDKSILTNYSKWREDYSKDTENKEEKKEEKKDTKNLEQKDKVDFKESLINSEISEDIFLDIEKKENKKENVKKEKKEPILTETQRLELIYGNVVPLHERRRRAKKKNSKFKNIKKENISISNSLNENKEKKEENTKKENKKEFKMPKIPFALKGTFSLTIILALCLVLFFGFKAYYSLNVQGQSIISGLLSKNENFYKNKLIYKDNNLSTEQTKSFIDVLNEDETKLNMIEKWIKEDLENLIKDKNYVSKRPIRLQKYGKIKGIFQDYKIILDSSKVKIQKPSLETTVLINGEEEKLKDQIYEVFPSKLTVFYYDNSIKLKNEAIVFPNEKNEEITISYLENKDYTISNESITLDTNSKESSFKIKTRDEKSILFVNDKNTNLTVKEFNNLESTNIKNGDELKLVTKMPWGYIVSDSISYDGSKNITLSAPLKNEKLKDIVIAKTLLSLKQFVYARGNKDLTSLSSFTKDALEFTKRDVQEVINSGRKFIGGYPSMEFDLSSFEVTEKNGVYKMFIGGHLLVQETSYGVNDKIPDITKVTPEERKVGFNFIYDTEKNDWLCEAWGFTAKHIERNNIKSVDLSQDMILK